MSYLTQSLSRGLEQVHNLDGGVAEVIEFNRKNTFRYWASMFCDGGAYDGLEFLCKRPGLSTRMQVERQRVEVGGHIGIKGLGID